jgi:ribonuclease BN (tRNA processing enzyme)
MAEKTEGKLVRLKVLGCGDAFGSGGRLNTCFLIDRGEESFLIDCGASAMISIRRFGVDPNHISAIMLSHLHADHFGGVPSFILDAQFVSRRTRPLVIAGPQGLPSRLEGLMEAHFPGSSKVKRRFPVEIVELTPEVHANIAAGLAFVTGYEVVHPSGTPSLALRVESSGKVISYTGDTEWTGTLLNAGRGADLLICECYQYDKKVPFHLDYGTLREMLPLMAAKRVLLTHMSAEMLRHVPDVQGYKVAEDGLEIELE